VKGRVDEERSEKRNTKNGKRKKLGKRKVTERKQAKFKGGRRRKATSCINNQLKKEKDRPSLLKRVYWCRSRS